MPPPSSRIAGAHAAPIPLAETGWLGGWLTAAAGLRPRPTVPLTVAHHADDTLALVRRDGLRTRRRAWRGPGTPSVSSRVVPDGARWVVASIALDAATLEPGTNLAGEPRDTVVFDRATADIAPAPACDRSRRTPPAWRVDARGDDGRGPRPDEPDDRRLHASTTPVRTADRAVPGRPATSRARRPGRRAGEDGGRGRRHGRRARSGHVRDRRRQGARRPGRRHRDARQHTKPTARWA